jgi:hypothetical protein
MDQEFKAWRSQQGITYLNRQAMNFWVDSAQSEAEDLVMQHHYSTASRCHSVRCDRTKTGAVWGPWPGHRGGVFTIPPTRWTEPV